jgi:hypothetical protein
MALTGMAYTMGGGSGLTGQRTNYNPAYGGIPMVPPPGASAGSAIGSNIGNLGQIYNLSGGVNAFNEQQLINQLIAGLPGYQANIGAASANTASNLAGMLPPDVINQMQIAAAERGVATGSPGGPGANAAYLAALGRSSLDLQTLGDRQLTEQIGRTPKAPLFDPSRMFITPEQVQEAQMAANLYASAPVPAAAAAERIRIAQTAGLPAGARPTGGFMGVDRGAGGGYTGPLTPYDQGGIVGPVGAGPWAQYYPQAAPQTWSPQMFATTAPADQYDPELMAEQYGYQPDLLGEDQGFESSEYSPEMDLQPYDETDYADYFE